MLKNLVSILILLFVFCVLASLPFIKIPISISSRGVIRSQAENTKLVSLVGGLVTASHLAHNNQSVQKGDTLLVVAAEHLVAQKNLHTSLRTDYTAQLQDLANLTNGYYKGLQTGQYQQELSAMQEKIAQVQAELSLTQKELNRTETLYGQGVMSKADLEKVYFKHQGLQMQIASIREVQMAQWQAQKRDIERQLLSLGAEIARVSQEQKNYIITAPSSGRLINFSGIQKGNFIIQGFTIGELCPDSAIVAECMISPNNIGFIKVGQRVKIQVDTYNYNQWGLLEATVKEIDQNITVNQQNGTAYFRVLCSLNKNHLELKNGHKGQIGKGMTLTARFYLLDRTLWQLLFDKVDDWFNPHLK